MELEERLPDKIRELEYEYTFDQTEFGKALIVASVTLLIVSAHSVLVFQSAAEDVEEVDTQFNKLSAFINSQQFNQSLQAMEDVQSTNIGERFRYATDTFRYLQYSSNTFGDTRQELEDTYRLYQWLVLLAILGIVAGITIIYI